MSESTRSAQFAAFGAAGMFGGSAALFGFGTYNEFAEHDASAVYAANAAFARAVVTMQLAGCSIWLFRFYEEKPTHERIVDIYRRLGVLNLHAAQPWNVDPGYKAFDSGMLLDRTVFWMSVTMLFALLIDGCMRLTRFEYERRRLRESEGTTKEAWMLSRRFLVMFPRIELNAIKFLVIPGMLCATAYVGEGLLGGKESEHLPLYGTVGFAQATFSYMFPLVFWLIQLYVLTYFSKRTIYLEASPAELMAQTFDEDGKIAKEFTAQTNKQASIQKRILFKRYGPKNLTPSEIWVWLQALVLEHLGSVPMGCWVSSPYTAFVERFGLLVATLRSTRSIFIIHIPFLDRAPALAESLRTVLHALVAMCCALTGCVGKERAPLSAMCAFLLACDVLLIITIRPYRSLLTNVACAWVSFCLGNGYWSFTAHFDPSKGGDDTPVSASWHMIGVVSSLLSEGMIVASALRMVAPSSPLDSIAERREQLEQVMSPYKDPLRSTGNGPSSSGQGEGAFVLDLASGANGSSVLVATEPGPSMPRASRSL